MVEHAVLSIKNHPDYEATIEEVVNHDVDEKLMREAIRRAKRESHAEALYVLYRLKGVSA